MPMVSLVTVTDGHTKGVSGSSDGHTKDSNYNGGRSSSDIGDFIGGDSDTISCRSGSSDADDHANHSIGNMIILAVT